ncbi:MAG: RNA polymerase-associated protein RapA [Syntrophomonadaceae bacterium]|nr:RNA polymerase-associated protein RapA [Bacillota bacterium]
MSTKIPDIIDNQSFLLKDAINILLEKSQLSKMAVGYFHLSGFNNIKENLCKVKNLKLLIGNSTDQETLDELVEGFIRLDLAKDFKDNELDYISPDKNKEIINQTTISQKEQLEYLEQSNNNEEGINTLSSLIEDEKVQIKVYTKGRLHSKAYLFEYDEGEVEKGIAVVGSSNLSYSGITHNSELNIVVRGEKNFDELNNWFEKLWNEAEDFDEVLLNVIKNSWVQNKVAPYEIYLKTLYNLVKDRLELDKTITILDEMNLPPLYDFQKKAFIRTLKILEIYNGVFVSDVVGLGKSFIGSSILKYYRQKEGKKGLIICPASLIKMWQERYNEKYELGAKVLSMGMLQYPTDNGQKIENYSLLDEEDLENYDIVLIDESHNFRNNNTDRYKILAPYLQNKKVILLTATPQNKTVWDIYYQIKLFHPLEKTQINIYPQELNKYFNQHQNDANKISNLLQHILIRRKRKDIINSYSPSLQGEKLTFPDRILKTINYSIEKTYKDGIYQKIKCSISCFADLEKRKTCPNYNKDCDNQRGLTYARYGLASYLKESAKKKKVYEGLSKAGTKLKGLMKMLLFKRFESSPKAFVETLNRTINIHRAFSEGLNKNILISGRTSQEEILSYGDDVYNEELYDFLEEENSRYDINDFHLDKLKTDIENDRIVLEDLKTLIEPITKNVIFDNKLLTLFEEIENIGENKILLFSEFKETAEYIHSKLKKEIRNKEIEVVYSEKSNIFDIIKRFAPKSNTENGLLKPHEKEIDILISTDVLSEGQNLQDANVVINYDIHWNPVRLIQRIGRVDRIGSEADKIFVYNFLPETNIEKEIGLQERVHNRIQEIHNILGEDNKILTDREILNEKSMYDIYEGKEDVLDRDVEDTIGTLEEAERTILELKQSNPDYFEYIKKIPDGVRSSLKKENIKGYFVFCEAKNYQKLYFADIEKNVITNDISDILSKIKCQKDEPRQVMPENYNNIINRIFIDFETEVRMREGEKKIKSLSRGQEYIRKELKAYFTQTSDLKEREKIELLERIFTSDLPQYVIASLTRLKRDKIVGKYLLEKLVEVCNIFNLSQIIKDVEDKKKKERLKVKIICSEALI